MSKIKTLKFDIAGEPPRIEVQSDGKGYGGASPSVVKFPVRYEAECRYRTYQIRYAALVYGKVNDSGTVAEAHYLYKEIINTGYKRSLKSGRLHNFAVPVSEIDPIGMCETDRKHRNMSVAEYIKKPREIHVRTNISFTVHCLKFGMVFNWQQEYGSKTIFMPLVVHCLPKPGSGPKPAQGTAELDKSGPKPRTKTRTRGIPPRTPRVAAPASDKAGPKPRTKTSVSARPGRKAVTADMLSAADNDFDKVLAKRGKIPGT